MDERLYIVTYDLLIQKSNYTEREGFECNISGFSTADVTQSLIWMYPHNKILIHYVNHIAPIDFHSDQSCRNIYNKTHKIYENERAYNDKKLDIYHTAKPVWFNEGS